MWSPGLNRFSEILYLLSVNYLCREWFIPYESFDIKDLTFDSSFIFSSVVFLYFTYIIAHAKSRNCMSDTVNTILISFPWLLFNNSLNYRMYITVTTPYSHKIDFSSLEITLHRGLHHSHFNSGDLQQINPAIRFRHIPTFGAGLIENHAFV